MATRVKRKVRIKKKNFAVFLAFIMFFAFSLYEIGFVIYKVITTTPREPEIEVRKPKKNTIKEEIPEYDKNLKKLNNVNQKVSYFWPENIDRYIKYKEKNKKMDDIQIVKNVNMNLDLTPYEDTFKALYLEKPNVLVNKYYYLAEDYIPANLEKISVRYALSGARMVSYAKNAFEDLASDAQKEGLNIVAMSAYRSYDYQINLYNRYKNQDGMEAADSYSGRPGHSEHQTGLAVDVYNEKESYTDFEETEEFDWMQENAYKYGFILRFPKDKEHETGYIYESWHYRYVGKKMAKYIHEHDISLEEYIATH